MSRFPFNPEDKKVADSLDGLNRLVAESVQWAATHRGRDPGLRTGLTELHRRVQRAATAARRPLTVALFGESQVGKSFLLAALCGAGGENIQVRKPAGDCAGAEWAGQSGIGFLEYINQEAKGQRETTGLVTRFSTEPHLQPEQPGTFAAAVISHSDLVDMLATGFRAECTGCEDVESGHINRFLDTIRAGSKPVDEARRQALLRAADLGMTIPQLGTSYQRALDGSNLRPFLRELSGDLEPRDWQRLASVFWGMGRYPALDAYYERSYGVLERLRFAPVAEIPWQVVCRAGRSDELKSVTSIEALESLFSTDNPRLAEVHYRAPDGRRGQTRLTIGEISVVTAELILPVLPGTGEKSLLDQADLLDFPGSVPHSGGSAPGPANFQSGTEGFAKASYVFRRGKLARLFENYCEARDITVLLQCADERNPTAMLMPGQLVRWLKSRYPGYPALPPGEQGRPSLFFVRTKADLLFKPHVAQIDTGDGATGEFIKAQVQFFERALDPDECWFTRWGGAGPFDNLYFVFRPQLFARSVQTSDNIRQEKQFFESSEWVSRHVGGKSERWSAFAPAGDPAAQGDGGVGYLVAHVVDKVEPSLKREELAAEQRQLISQFAQLLPQPVASDLAVRRQQAVAAAEAILAELRSQEDQCAFGRLLLRLSLPESMAAKAMAAKGDLVSALSQRWRERVLTDGGSQTAPGLKGLGRLTDEIDRFKQRQFRGLLNAPTFRFLAGGTAAPAVAARVVARLWNGLHLDLGVPLPATPLPEMPVRIGADSKPWRRLFAHWEIRLPQIYQENASEGVELPPGNDELVTLTARLQKGVVS